MTEADITFEDVKLAAAANCTTVDTVLATITNTAAKDRAHHPAELTDPSIGHHRELSSRSVRP
jgi:hypothetical protein